MTNLMDGIVRGTGDTSRVPGFPHAPQEWTPALAIETAGNEGLDLGDEHWQALRALHEYYSRHDGGVVNLRELHDALDEKFHQVGGIRHLYQIFPGGPVAQGCRIAGLKVPAGAVDKSFGSVA